MQILASVAGLAVFLGLADASPAHAASPQGAGADSLERARAIHVLHRLGYGPRPGDVERLVSTGVDRYIQMQLDPRSVPDAELDQRLYRFTVLELSTEEHAELFRRERQRRLEAQRRSRDSADTSERDRRRRASTSPIRRLTGELQQLVVTRAVLSERQLYEVMVDFWYNHFNVFLGKGPERYLVPAYVEDVIRPNAMGSFEDLLIATATSPAMLVYLDNAQSVAADATPPQLARMQRMMNVPRSADRQFGRNISRDSLRARMERIEARLPKGLNENYARELLELHTLGVDGGYTQEDVVHVARILTGWSADARRGTFVFNEWAHDNGEKTVLGTTFSGRGVDEGTQLLRMLASHPSTVRHLSRKLCIRFVSDNPAVGCVDAAVKAWTGTDGDIPAVLAAIFASRDFWDEAHRDSKTKTPLEFVASAVRALGGTPDSTLRLAQVVARLGQPIYLQQPPTGYPETQASWVSSSSLIDRLNIAMAFAARRAPGVSGIDATVRDIHDVDSLVAFANHSILNGRGSASTLSVLREQASSARHWREAQVLVLGLALGSPEFQRQ